MIYWCEFKDKSNNSRVYYIDISLKNDKKKHTFEIYYKQTII